MNGFLYKNELHNMYPELDISTINISLFSFSLFFFTGTCIGTILGPTMRTGVSNQLSDVCDVLKISTYGYSIWCLKSVSPTGHFKNGLRKPIYRETIWWHWTIEHPFLCFKIYKWIWLLHDKYDVEVIVFDEITFFIFVANIKCDICLWFLIVFWDVLNGNLASSQQILFLCVCAHAGVLISLW